LGGQAFAIRAEGLEKSYGKVPVFAGMSFELPLGGSLAILGHSGCGKTTLLRVLQGLTLADSGTLEFGPGMRGRSLVMQDHGLFPWKNAWDNLELPLRLSGVPKASRGSAVKAMLSGLGLAGLGRRYPSELSGGERQRLALGRSLIMRPGLLLLDEPFSSLDQITREGLQGFLAGLWRSLGLSMALSTHSAEEAVRLGGTVLVLGATPTKVVASVPNPAVEGAGNPDDAPRVLRLLREALRDARPPAAALGAAAGHVGPEPSAFGGHKW
jgi:NitT/TauT family transport system ATP-binding protein